MTSILSLTVISLIFTGGLQSQANAITLTIDPASAEWIAVSGGVNIIGLNTDEVRWGIPVTGTSKSGLKFTVITTPTNVATNTPFELGTLTHFNFPIFVGASGATLGIDMTVTNGNTDNAMFTFSFAIDETTNSTPCGPDQVSATPCDDIITFPGAISSQTVTIDGVDFTLTLLGFGSTANNLINKFVTEEGKSSSTKLFAQLESVELPVDIDVKPGSDPNSYPCKDVNKEIPVAVLSDAAFDATTIDADTVRYGVNGNEAAEVHEKKGDAKRHVEDKNKDGLPDMVFHFKLSDTGFSCDDIAPGKNSITLNSILTGTTIGGQNFEGTDFLRLVRQ